MCGCPPLQTVVSEQAMPPLFDWGLRKAELCFPSQTGFSKKGHPPPLPPGLSQGQGLGPPALDWRPQRLGLCLPAWTGYAELRLCLLVEDWGVLGKGGGWAGGRS